MKPAAPYLSIILAARNDNYGGDFNDRLHNSVHWLHYFVEKNKLPSELLVVDYNPVPGNEPLIKMINWPKNSKYLSIRLLHVPAETHKMLINPAVRKTVPLFEFVAKNIAIRRAQGEYILCTNADILLHPSIIKFVAQKIPHKKYYYRADRFDYKKINSYNFSDPYSTLSNIKRQVFRLMLKGYAYEVNGGENYLEKVRLKFKNSLHLFLDCNMIEIEPFAYKWEIHVNYDGYLMKYHTHCSGDFMLMHRDNWFKLRGYPEDTYISTHCDGLFTVMSRVSRLKECTLGWPVYHQDHERRYNTDFDKIKDNQDINNMFNRLLNDTREMETLRKPKIVNSPDWGHGNENFAETFI